MIYKAPTSIKNQNQSLYCFVDVNVNLYSALSQKAPLILDANCMTFYQCITGSWPVSSSLSYRAALCALLTSYLLLNSWM